MRVNIYQNNICSIDFETVDQVIDFIKKFNKNQEDIKTITVTDPIPLKTEPFKSVPVEPWYNSKDFIISDPIPDPHVVYCTGKNANYTTTITYDTTIE